jgi:hypothetical protein
MITYTKDFMIYLVFLKISYKLKHATHLSYLLYFKYYILYTYTLCTCFIYAAYIGHQSSKRIDFFFFFGTTRV